MDIIIRFIPAVDFFSVKIEKWGIGNTYKILTYIFNFTFKTCTVPDKIKVAK